MHTFRKQFRTLALATAMTPFALAAAQAQDVDAALARLKALVEEQGITIDWADAEVSGSDVVLVDVEVGADGDVTPIGNVNLAGVSETDTGYRIEEISFEYYEMTEEETSVMVDGVSMTGVTLPNEGEGAAYGGFMFYETFDLGQLAIRVKDADAFTLTDLHVELNTPQEGDPIEFNGAAEGFTVDLSNVEDPQQKATLQALGYETLEGFIEMAGSWQPSDGRMTLSQYDLTVVDAGTFGLSFDFGGYTPAFIKSLGELQKQMAANPEGDTSSQGLAMLGLMQQLTFHQAEVAFIDDTLTNKVLKYVADQQGMQPSDIANQAKAVLPFALAQLNNPELTAMVTKAVSAFLDDPQSLRITAAPGEPVPFALIMAGAMSTPQELPKTLGVTVTANE